MLSLTRYSMCALALAGAPAALHDGSDFALTTQGGVTLTTTGSARFGIVQGNDQNPAFFSLTLGAEDGNGALVLSNVNGAIPLAGRYAVQSSDKRTAKPSFQALFIAGTPTEPKGVFHGESGSITIRRTSPGLIEGVFTIQARGFRAEAPDQDDISVTIHGTFVAHGEQVMAQVTSVSPAASM
jgi:hypothetical protein